MEHDIEVGDQRKDVRTLCFNDYSLRFETTIEAKESLRFESAQKTSLNQKII